MKFFICALALCALSMNSNASVVPLPLSSPLLYSTAFGSGLSIAPSVIPTTHLVRAPLAFPLGLNAEGTYIAKTLGSEHIATLPGHLNSASSINLELAPGIKKEDYIKEWNSALPVAIHGSAFPAALPLTYSSVIVPQPIVVAGEATYTAKNLGVEHKAPLPGHFISTTSLNLESAPGSK